jgi:alkaline phosphatase
MSGHILTIIFQIGLISVQAQPLHYTPGNAHSHNDYENPVPFWTAYNAGFGSIEADIWLQPDGKLLVGHDLNEIKNGRTLEQYYLDPMKQCVEKNHQHIYADTGKHLQLLIDVKTEAVSTLKRLIEVLQQFPHLTENPKIIFVISGNRPAPENFTSYPSFISFDGDPLHAYTDEQQKKIGLLSDNFVKYAFWNGSDSMPAASLAKIQDAISKAHMIKKPIRFWASPDKPNAWRQLMKLGVDYINTDKIDELAAFLK